METTISRRSRQGRQLAAAAFAAMTIAVDAAAGLAQQRAGEPASTKPSAVAAPPTPFRFPRYNEDWSFLKDPAASHSFLDPIKYIPLGGADDVYLTLGGEARLVYEFFDNNAFGAGPQDDDGFLLQRYMLFADLHVTEAFRAFVEGKSNLIDDRVGGPRPPDEDQLDLHQAFVDISGKLSDDLRLTLRPGRQELLYGSARLIANRNGPNTRQSFDAVKAMAQAGPWSVDGFFARPVETDTGVFDDQMEDDRSLWAAYATTRQLGGWPGGLDVYYIGYHNDFAVFDSGAGEETRHTFGTRYFGKRGSLDWNWELIGQAGDFAGRDIRAWSIGTDTGYTWEHAALSPRVALKANLISGDTDPDDDTLGTFNAMFPRGGYFGEIGVIGPANLINLHPSLDLNLRRDLMLTLDCLFFWRYSEDDGIYNAPGALIRPNRTPGGGASSERYVGTQPSVILTYRPTDQLLFIGTYTLFLPGGYIDDTGPDETISFVRLEAQFRF